MLGPAPAPGAPGRSSTSASPTISGGRKRSMPRPRAVDHEPGLEAAVAHRGRVERRRRASRRPSGPRPAHLGDAVELAEPGHRAARPRRARPPAAPRRPARRAPPAPPRAPTGPPAKVEPWSPGSKTSPSSGVGHHRADRQAAAERLGGRHHVGPHRKLLVRPQACRSAPSRSGPRRRRAARRSRRTPRAPRRGPRRRSGRSRPRPGSARSGRRRSRARTAARSASASSRAHRDEAARQRPEPVVVGEPRRRRQRAERPAVEAAVEADDLRDRRRPASERACARA